MTELRLPSHLNFLLVTLTVQLVIVSVVCVPVGQGNTLSTTATSTGSTETIADITPTDSTETTTKVPSTGSTEYTTEVISTDTMETSEVISTDSTESITQVISTDSTESITQVISTDSTESITQVISTDSTENTTEALQDSTEKSTETSQTTSTSTTSSTSKSSTTATTTTETKASTVTSPEKVTTHPASTTSRVTEGVQATDSTILSTWFSKVINTTEGESDGGEVGFSTTELWLFVLVGVVFAIAILVFLVCIIKRYRNWKIINSYRYLGDDAHSILDHANPVYQDGDYD